MRHCWPWTKIMRGCVVRQRPASAGGTWPPLQSLHGTGLISSRGKPPQDGPGLCHRAHKVQGSYLIEASLHWGDLDSAIEHTRYSVISNFFFSISWKLSVSVQQYHRSFRKFLAISQELSVNFQQYHSSQSINFQQ